MLDKTFLQEYRKRKNIPNNPRRNLAEYLQSEILFILYNSKYGKNLSFMGGTCLRFVYELDRFSEDLDFELIGNEKINYEELADFIKKELDRLGFSIETKFKERENVIVIFVKFSVVLKEMGLSELKNQKLKIKFEIDPSPARSIECESKLISSYGRNFYVIANNLPTIFAQKFIALANRPYRKGRDFYDLIWFLAQRDLEPNYKLLKEKGYKTKNRKEFSTELQKIITKTNLNQAVKDVEKFLFYPEKAQWILNFQEYLKNWK
jgi:predicted nucleotidyltransferase component of viral defense system